MIPKAILPHYAAFVFDLKKSILGTFVFVDCMNDVVENRQYDLLLKLVVRTSWMVVNDNDFFALKFPLLPFSTNKKQKREWV